MSIHEKKLFNVLSKEGIKKGNTISNLSANTDLFSKAEGMKKLFYLSENGLLDDDTLADHFQNASLIQIDSILGQIRERIPGAERGKRPAHPRGLSYKGHFETPKTLAKLIDIFIFSKNAVSDHTITDRYIPPAVKLKIFQDKQILEDFCEQSVTSIINKQYPMS